MLLFVRLLVLQSLHDLLRLFASPSPMVVVEEQAVDEEQQHQDARRHEEVARDIIGAADDLREESGKSIDALFRETFHTDVYRGGDEAC